MPACVKCILGESLHTAFTLLFATVAVCCWTGLASAELGMYRAPLVVGAAVAAAAAYGWKAAGTWDPEQPAARSVVPLVACLALAAVLFARPGEYAIDGGDGSVYLNLGRAVARSGSLSFSEPILDRLDPSLWPALFERERAWPHLLNLFPGGMQLEPGVNRVLPNFFHLFPIWIASVEGVAGRRGGYFANVVLGVAAVGALWMLGARLSGSITGTAAAALLALNFAEIWFARISTSEVLTQFLVLSGLYFALCHARRPGGGLGVCAGAAFGLAGLCRIDALVLVSPVVALYLVFLARERPLRHWLPFAAVFGALTLHATLHALIWSGPYTQRILWHLFGTGWVTPASLLGPIAVVAAGVVFWALLARRASSRALWLIAPVAGLAVGGRVALHAVSGHPEIVLTALGIAAAIAGAALLLFEHPDAESVLIVAVFGASAAVYFDSVRDMVPMPMLLRRFVPVILPLALLLAAHGFVRVSSLVPRLRWLVWAGPAVLGVLFAMRSAPLAAATMQGTDAQLAALAALCPPQAVILADGSSPSHLGLSLRYTEGRDVLSVRRGEGTAAALAAVADMARSTGRRVFLLAGVEGARADGWLRRDDFEGFDLRSAGTVAFPHLDLEPTVDRLPSQVRRLTPVVELYEVMPERAEELPVQVDIGEHDFGRRCDGFHDAEWIGGTLARWSGGAAAIMLPRIHADPNGAGVLELRLAAPRPPGIAAPDVAVDLDGVPLGSVGPLTPEFRTYAIRLDRNAMRELTSSRGRLGLRAPAFVPRTAGAGQDDRTLGVLVDWLRLGGS